MTKGNSCAVEDGAQSDVFDSSWFVDPVVSPPRDPLFDTVVIPVCEVTRELPRVQGAAASHMPTTRPVPTIQVIGYRNSAVSRQKHEAAPRSLRLGVLALFLILVTASAGLIELRANPGRFVGLRNYERSLPTRPNSDPLPGSRAELLSTSATMISYAVPAASYSIELVVAHPCWIVVRSLAKDAVPLLAQTIMPTSRPFAIAVHGGSSITIAAQAASISVVAGTRTLDTIVAPKLSVAYTFVPGA